MQFSLYTEWVWWKSHAQIQEKEGFCLIRVSKEEATIIRKECPKSPIVRSMKQRSKRHRYWSTLSSEVAKLLSTLRNQSVIEIYKSEDA